jgi:Fe-S cluster assembly protein SufD
MADTPRIITRVRRGEKTEKRDFIFTEGMLPIADRADFIKEYRLNAWEAYKNLSIPTVQEDAWRRTDIKELQVENFQQSRINGSENETAIPLDLLKPLTGDINGGQVLLMPSGAQVAVNAELAAKGIILTDLLTAEKEYPHLLEKIMGKLVLPGESKFSALAGAFANNGVLLYVPKGIQVGQPLHSLLWGPGINRAYLSHILVYLEEGSSVTYVHESASMTESAGQSLHAGIVEIYVGPSANLRFVELQSWGQHVWNFSHERVKVDRDGTLEWIFGAIGSHLTKNFSELNLFGQGSTGKMSGFYFTNHDQHLDHDTQQNHLARNTTSDLLFKGALLDESRSVWQGMIYVAPGAAKSDGYQANRNLILSPKSRADSIPGLEILADDVRCTHGAAVGKIDSEQIFYLQSRGIPAQEAERLIVEGFFDPIMQRIPFDGVRLRFQEAIHNKMETFRRE